MSEVDEIRARSRGRIGTTLRGKYHLDRVLGMGGMAVVYAATHRNRKQFAIKVLHAELSHRDDVRTRFLREGYAANSLKHPGAVAVLDDDVGEDGSAFLVMELLEGDVVDALWSRCGGRLPTRAVLALGHQLLDVLAAAHAQGIVHRDIKPPNLFLTLDGTLKVLDFGIARVREAAASGVQTTGTGMVLGSPAFMAPEQALGESGEIDGRTDLWAAGATLFSLLSGRPVHEGENATQLIVKAATTRPRSLASVAPDVPAPVVEVIDAALAFGKAARWASAETMRDAIRDAYAALFSEPVSPAPLRELIREAPPPAPPSASEASWVPAESQRGEDRESPRTEVEQPRIFRPPDGSVVVPARSPTIPLSAPDPARLIPPRPLPGPAGTLLSGEVPVGARTPPLAGMMTSNPVSSDKVVAYGASRRPLIPLLLLGAAAALAAIALGVVQATRRPPPPEDSFAGAPAASSPVASSTPPTPVPLPATATATGPIPVVPPAVTPPAAAPSHEAARASPAGPSSTSAGRSAKPAAPCRVVTTIDKRGDPHFSCPCATCE